jgi:hypothetical protein
MVRKTKLELSTERRRALFSVLWENQVNGRPGPGAAKRLAIQFEVDFTTINRLLRATKSKIDAHLNILQNGAPIENEGFSIFMLVYVFSND